MLRKTFNSWPIPHTLACIRVLCTFSWRYPEWHKPLLPWLVKPVTSQSLTHTLGPWGPWQIWEKRLTSKAARGADITNDPPNICQPDHSPPFSPLPVLQRQRIPMRALSGDMPRLKSLFITSGCDLGQLLSLP